MSALHWLSKMTWQEADEWIARVDVCVLPCGSLEQHGPHLPLDTDTKIAVALSERLADRLAERIRVLTLPPLTYGLSPEHMAFSGTVTLARETLCNVVLSICRSIASHGAQRLLLINAHGGNTSSLASLLRQIRRETGLWAYLFDVCASESVRKYAPALDLHAGLVETSLMMAISPAAVREVGANSPTAPNARWEAALRLCAPWNAEELSATGAIGKPREANQELGQALLNDLVDEMAALLTTIVGAEGMSK